MSAVLDEIRPEDVDVIVEDNTPIQQPDTNQSRTANRFLFLAIDVITPSRKRACKRLRFGGHEVISECLVTRNFVQKGRITGLVRSGEPILEENAPDNSDFFPISMPPKIDIPNALIMQGMSESPVGAIPSYPGDHLAMIRNGSGSKVDDRQIGLVEIEKLRNHSYHIQELAPGLRVDKDIWRINRYFFPGFPKVPVRLTGFRALIEKGHAGTHDSAYRSIAEDMLASCEIGSLWATETLDAKERLIAQSRGHQGYAYVYDELDESLMLQMGRDKVEGAATIATKFAEIAESGKADVAELATAIKEGNRDFARMLAEELAKVRAESVLTEPSAPKAPEEVTITKKK